MAICESNPNAVNAASVMAALSPNFIFLAPLNEPAPKLALKKLSACICPAFEKYPFSTSAEFLRLKILPPNPLTETAPFCEPPLNSQPLEFNAPLPAPLKKNPIPLPALK